MAYALEYLTRLVNRRAVVFLISDFLAPEFNKALKIANKKHDIIAVVITDPREVELAPVGLVELEDAETGETLLVDTGFPRFRDAFRRSRLNSLEKLYGNLNASGVDYISIMTDKPYVPSLVSFFRARANRWH